MIDGVGGEVVDCLLGGIGKGYMTNSRPDLDISGLNEGVRH